MFAYKKQIGRVFWGLSISSTLLLSACVPPASSPSNEDSGPTYSALSEKTQNCIESIRTKMEKGQLVPLQGAPHQQLIEEVESQLGKNHKTVYTASGKGETLLSIGIQRSKTIELKQEHRLEQNIEVGQKKNQMQIKVELAYTKETSSKNLTYSESHLVDETCTPQLETSSLIEIKKVAESAIEEKIETWYRDNTSTARKNSYRFDSKNKLIVNFSPRADDKEILKLNQEIYFHAPGIGIAQVQSKKVGTRQAKILNTEYPSEQFELQYIFQSQAPVTASVDIIESIDASVTDSSLGSRNLELPYQIWKSISLLSSSDSPEKIQSKITAEQLAENPRLKITTDKKLDYPFMSAYWQVQTQKLETKQWQYSMTESPTPEYQDKVTPEDLASNEIIQTDLPEIQTIAQQISARTRGNRAEQIREILWYLGSQYRYDHDMVASNSVRPLSTQEALDRQKGVCQHYAVIFTSIARALQIPTRIVVGYSLGDQLVGHAWVEVEISPNRWRVVEPQDVTGLSATKTRYYLPLNRGYSLEGNTANLISESQTFSFDWMKLEMGQ